MKFKVLSTEIYISFLFIAVVAVMLATDKTGLLLPSLFAIIMHELSHLFAMWLVDCAPKKIRLIPASIQIIRRFGITSKNEIAIALCGPLANIVLFLVLYFNFLAYNIEMSLYYALINLLVGVFNLLPVIGLDGGTILFEIISKKTDFNKATKILKAITLLITLLTASLAVLLLIKGSFNPSIFILAIYFFIMFLMKI